MKLDIVVAGVGGQGVLFLSQVVGQAAVLSDLRVKICGIYGAARRGGSVHAHIRMSEREISSPIIPEGGADAVVSLELLEGLRAALKYLSSGGFWITDSRRILPAIVRAGGASYPTPEKIKEAVESLNARFLEIDSEKTVREEKLNANMFILGAARGCGALPLEISVLEKAIVMCSPPESTDRNLKAFRLGCRRFSG